MPLSCPPSSPAMVFDRRVGARALDDLDPAPFACLAGRAPLLVRLAYAAALSGLFFLVYGGCLRITALRADVGTCALPFERHIPFVPAMIVPYLSIDLFFFASFLLCTTRAELITHARRIGLAVVVAGACFLLFPLRFAFDTPHAGGWAGALVAWFKAADMPYNLAPSLHIALRSILWPVYRRHTRSAWLRRALGGWFVLIGASTVLVYQHHLIDVAAGHLLAVLCLGLVTGRAAAADPPDPPVRDTRRRVVAFRYAAGAAACFAVAVALRGWVVLLAWPGVSLAVIAAAYRRGDPHVYGKSAASGRLPMSTYLVHGPVLLAQRLTWAVQALGRPAAAPIAPALWIGRRLGADTLARLARPHRPRGAGHPPRPGALTVIDLTAELPGPGPRRLPPGVSYLPIPLLDLCTPGARVLAYVVRRMRQAERRGPVYVHCALGYGRSALAAAAYLLDSGRARTAAEAVRAVAARRPGAVFGPESLRLLRRMYPGSRQSAVGSRQ